MADTQPDTKIRTLVFGFIGLLVTTSFLVLGFKYYYQQKLLWKAELTRKAVITATSFASSLNSQDKIHLGIKTLESNIEEIKQVNILKKAEDKYQLFDSTENSRIGEILESKLANEAYNKNSPTTISSVEKTYNQKSGITEENHYIDTYVKSQLADFVVNVKFLTNDVDIILNEHVLMYSSAFSLTVFALLLFLILCLWQIHKGWELFSRSQEIVKNKDNILSMTVHDMNAPLTAIKASLSVFLENYGQQIPTGGKTLIDKTYTITQELIDLVEDILTASRFERGKIETYPRPTVLRDLITEQVSIYEEKAKSKQLTMDVDVREGLPKVLADPEKIKEVISNLISNTIKYSLPGEIKIWVTHDSGFLTFHIRDKGEGIAPKDISRLFQSFSRLKSKGKERGTGLGLYISRLIIESHKGKIWVDSKIGDGSIFSFSLPIVRELSEENPFQTAS